MRVLKYWECFLFSLIAGAIYLLGLGLASDTHASVKPLWTKQCTAYVSKDKSRFVEDCDTISNADAIDPEIATAIGDRTIPVTCNVYQHHWPLKTLKLACHVK